VALASEPFVIRLFKACAELRNDSKETEVVAKRLDPRIVRNEWLPGYHHENTTWFVKRQR
jgi:hypothetical protein